MHSPTLFMLMASYGGPTIKLDSISETYFGMAPKTAQAKATAGLLPIPAFRASQKSPYQVHLADLAHYIDSKRDEASYRVEQLSVKPRR
ncbi:pyocin activator PrtN family protein [Shewanella sp.]|uniref:pyocin activator PrtN family protein n=1 Tax=Shewanella sp. TaxID=50422 RepID=UPI003A976F76